MMEKISVALIEPIGGHGGMNFYDYGLSQGLANNNVKVYFFTSDSTVPVAIPNVETIASFSSMWKKKSKILKVVLYIRGLVHALVYSKRRKADLLHLHVFHFGWLFFFAILICKLFGFKVVVTIH